MGVGGELRVPVHLARRAAQESRDLSPEAADHADRLLVWRPRRLNPHRVGVLIHEARLYADPDRAIADHDAALASRRVDVDHHKGAPGCSQVLMLLDTADAIGFDATVSTMAATMGALGHPGDLDVRRANAVGILADPQRALDLLAVDPDPDGPDGPDGPDPETDPAVCAAEDAMYAGPNPFVRLASAGSSGQPAGEAVLVLHVTDRDLLDGGLVPGRGGVARSDKLGPVLLGRLQAWLFSAGKVTITPVLDLDAKQSVDAHDPPDRMAEAVRLRDETCVFPHCNRPSGRSDLDHIDPYVDPDEGGPPGQTHRDNLAPLCRRHHRAKTHAEFAYRRLPDGSYRWILPTGIEVTTDPPTPRPQPRPRPRP